MIDWDLKPYYVKYKGIFDLDALYDYVYRWLQDRKYRTQEKKYKHKPDSPWGYEHEIKIQGSHKVDGYYMYILDVTIQCRDTARIEIDGKQLYTGRLLMEFGGKVVTDYGGRFEANAFTKILEKILNKIIIREIELVHWDVLYYRVQDFQEEIKGMLNMYAQENYFKL